MADIKLHIDYDEFDPLEDRFYGMSEDITLLLDDLHKHVENLRHSGWTGVGAENFFHEMYSQVFPAIVALCDVLYSCSRLIDNVAEIYSTAEHEASRHLYK